MSKNHDDEAMLDNLKRLLGMEAWEVKSKTKVCNHSSDGHIYGEAPTYNILRCEICGEHYNEYFN